MQQLYQKVGHCCDRHDRVLAWVGGGGVVGGFENFMLGKVFAGSKLNDLVGGLVS